MERSAGSEVPASPRATSSALEDGAERKQDDKPSAPSSVTGAEWWPSAICWACPGSPQPHPAPHLGDSRETGHPRGPKAAGDTHSQAGSRPTTPGHTHPCFAGSLPFPHPHRGEARGPGSGPGLLSHRSGAACESVSRKGHLQPLASDVPAAWPHNLLEAPARDPRFSGGLLGLWLLSRGPRQVGPSGEGPAHPLPPQPHPPQLPVLVPAP